MASAVSRSPITQPPPWIQIRSGALPPTASAGRVHAHRDVVAVAGDEPVVDPGDLLRLVEGDEAPEHLPRLGRAQLVERRAPRLRQPVEQQLDLRVHRQRLPLRSRGPVGLTADIMAHRPAHSLAVEAALHDPPGPPGDPPVALAQLRHGEAERAGDRGDQLGPGGERVAAAHHEEGAVPGALAEAVGLLEHLGLLERRWPASTRAAEGHHRGRLDEAVRSWSSCTVNSMSDSEPRPSFRWNSGSSPGPSRSCSMRTFMRRTSRSSSPVSGCSTARGSEARDELRAEVGIAGDGARPQVGLALPGRHPAGEVALPARRASATASRCAPRDGGRRRPPRCARPACRRRRSGGHLPPPARPRPRRRRRARRRRRGRWRSRARRRRGGRRR